MEQPTNEQEVIRLLTSLKKAESDYPSDLLKSRREMFIQQAAVVVAAAAMNTALKVNNDGGNAGRPSSAPSTASSSIPASMGTLLEAVLVVAIVVEVAAAAYLFRDKIAEFFNTVFSPRVEQIVNPPDPVDISNPGDAILTETPNPTMTDPSPATDTYTITTPQNGSNNNSSGGSGSGGGSPPPAVSTPEPTRPGLHIGQTPKPDRTQPAPSRESNDK
jgi:hypothetical protein